jgi:hypothetical protein
MKCSSVSSRIHECDGLRVVKRWWPCILTPLHEVASKGQGFRIVIHSIECTMTQFGQVGLEPDTPLLDETHGQRSLLGLSTVNVSGCTMTTICPCHFFNHRLVGHGDLHFVHDVDLAHETLIILL